MQNPRPPSPQLRFSGRGIDTPCCYIAQLRPELSPSPDGTSCFFSGMAARPFHPSQRGFGTAIKTPPAELFCSLSPTARRAESHETEDGNELARPAFFFFALPCCMYVNKSPRPHIPRSHDRKFSLRFFYEDSSPPSERAFTLTRLLRRLDGLQPAASDSLFGGSLDLLVLLHLFPRFPCLTPLVSAVWR